MSLSMLHDDASTEVRNLSTSQSWTQSTAPGWCIPVINEWIHQVIINTLLQYLKTINMLSLIMQSTNGNIIS
jgi:hypothetical protein